MNKMVAHCTPAARRSSSDRPTEQRHCLKSLSKRGRKRPHPSPGLFFINEHQCGKRVENAKVPSFDPIDWPRVTSVASQQGDFAPIERSFSTPKRAVNPSHSTYPTTPSIPSNPPCSDWHVFL
jgi:hypothetical protein